MIARRAYALGLVVSFYSIAACVSDDPILPNDEADDGGVPDATTSTDASTADVVETGGNPPPEPPCNPDAPFATPILVVGLDSTGDDGTPALTIDEREIYFTRTTPPGTANGAGIYHAKRDTLRAAFQSPTPFFDRPNAFDSDPFVASDNETIFAALVGMPGSAGNADIYLIAKDGGAVAVGGVNTANFDGNPFLTADGKELWFAREAAGLGADGGPIVQLDIFRGQYAAGAVTGITAVSELNNAKAREEWPVLTSDKKTIYFASMRTDAVPAGSKQNIWTAHRSDPDGTFGAPSPLTVLNSPFDDAPRWVSPDGCRIYLRSDRGDDHKKAIYMAERPH